MYYLKKDMAVAKHAYFDIIRGIKINRVLPVDLELLNLATYRLYLLYNYYSSEKNLKTIHLLLNPEK